MKRFFVIMITAAMFAACNSVTESPAPGNGSGAGKDPFSDTANFTSIEWLDSTHQDLGTVKQGQVTEVVYNFRNSGDKPLFVDAKPGCGCTVADVPKEPIQPGESGKIRGKFDSKGQGVGPHTKTISFSSNAHHFNHTSLSFSVRVTE